MRWTRILLAIIAVVCFGVALSYPIRYRLAQKENNDNMDELSAMRSKAQQEQGVTPDAGGAPADDSPRARGETGDAEPDAPTEAGEPGATAQGDDTAPATQDDSTAPVSQGETTQSNDTAPATQSGTIARDDDNAPVPQSGTTQDNDPAPASQGGTTQDAAPASQGGTTQDEATAPASQGDGATKVNEPSAEDLARGMPKRPTIAPDEPGGAQPTDAEGASGRADAGAAGTRVEPDSGNAAPADAGTGSLGEPQTGDAGVQPQAGGAQPLPEATQPPTPVPQPTPEPEPTPVPTPTPTPGIWDLLLDGFETPTPTPRVTATPRVAPTIEPTVTPVWDEYTGPLPYPMLEKVEFDPDAILPELQDIYALNHDLVGWICIPDTVIDYPVVQCQDSDFYLKHDFYGNDNINGQIILDTKCDPYTPSYNLIISGHHMKNGSMFGDLPLYQKKSYWEAHRFIEFDTLMFRKKYVIFGAFYSADYDEDETGFRYNANIQYAMEARMWLDEVDENRLYETGVDVEFGDEFITLTTCNRARHRNGRFVVVARKIREGETFE